MESPRKPTWNKAWSGPNGWKMLVDEGALVIKFWLHLSKEQQENRLKSLEKNPLTRWKVTDRDWKRHKAYEKFQEVHENVIRHTSTAEAPWLIVEGADAHYRNLTIGKVILKAIQDRLEQDKRRRPRFGCR